MENAHFRPSLRRTVFFLALLTPTIAAAHPGFPGHTHGFGSGLVHPLTGLDHVLAMIAVGIFAALSRHRGALWRVPLVFISMMAIGGFLGLSGMGSCPLVEQAVAASVLIFGILIAGAALPGPASLAIIGTFALFHGYAHGAEMPATTSGFVYALGFLFATALLHACGIGLGLAAQKMNSQKSAGYVGCAIAASGLYLIFAA